VQHRPEFIAEELRKWLGKLSTKTLYSEPGSPWENGYCESFNGKLRDEFLDGEIFYSLKEAQILTERWRVEYNTERPHSALGYRPPAPQAILQATGAWRYGKRSAFPTSPHPRRRQRTIVHSGGIQEETTYLGIPCLTMRENTERPIAVSMGTNVLV
jgi:transposase InsO family protein